MPLILIADSCKASLVMTSEIFKDNFSQVQVVVALSGEECLSLAAKNKPDLILVDFDLPDADGAALIRLLRKTYKGPILMTAHPYPDVKIAVAEDLFAYSDASEWIPKPVKAEQLITAIQRFLLENRRLTRRFPVSFETALQSPAKDNKKKSSLPEIKAKCINLSLTGALFKLQPEKSQNKINLRFGSKLELDLPKNFELANEKLSGSKAKVALAAAKSTSKKKVAKKTGKAATGKAKKIPTLKVSGKVIRIVKNVVAVQFTGLSEGQQSDIETYLKNSFQQSL
ncbi:MAG: response regulator [Oligoflexales bacterium]|nr:response regulator [Oligoflexales bacterium]